MRAAVPVLASVAAKEKLWRLHRTTPNESEEGLSKAAGIPESIPVRVMVWGEFWAESVSVRTAVRGADIPCVVECDNNLGSCAGHQTGVARIAKREKFPAFVLSMLVLVTAAATALSMSNGNSLSGTADLKNLTTECQGRRSE